MIVDIIARRRHLVRSWADWMQSPRYKRQRRLIDHKVVAPAAIVATLQIIESIKISRLYVKDLTLYLHHKFLKRSR